MPSYSLSHLSDEVLSRELTLAAASERTAIATLVAHLAEFDARRLYLPAGFPSLYAYCVQELHLSEDAACLRIHAARLARRFPAILQALAAGRLTLSAVVRLASHLGEDNADELLAAAAHQSKAAIERLLAERFPRLDLPTQVVPLAPPASTTPGGEPTVALSVPERIEPPAPRPKVTALSPQRYGLQVTVSQETHDKLRHAQELLGPQVRSNDVAEVLDRALDALIRQLGEACITNLRLRCRAHNQYEAERTFGVEFMRRKREQARCAAAGQAHVEEVIPWLRQLGFRADEARSAAALCASSPEASLDQRVRLALSYFRPRTKSPGQAAPVWAG